MNATDQPVFIHELSGEQIDDYLAHAPDGPLAGVRFAVKDNLDLAGVATTAGFPPRAAQVAAAHAEAVRRLIGAGAVPVGKTNLDQFATGLVGARSPYGACHAVGHPAHLSGGSSSGSAVAVASGLVPLALGTDTAGSGRVPAAFNGIVGVKPTRGLVSTRGLLPACRSLDCVTAFTRTVGEARTALSVLAGFDAQDPYARPAPASTPLIAREFRVIAVPDRPLDLDPEHEAAWRQALARAGTLADEVIEVDVSAFLEAAQLLYQGPWIAERRKAVMAAVGSPDHPDLDPAVRAVLRGADALSAQDAFSGFERLAELRRATEPLWLRADALLLPVTPGHPTHAQLAADPVGVNARLGRFTNFVNLLDLSAVAVPAGERADGLPFGVQFIAPAFADAPLLDWAARWTGEAVAPPAPPAGQTLLAVAGAHLSGLPLNPQLLDLGARLSHRTRTAAGYRLYRLPGSGVARPALVFDGTGTCPPDGIPVEVWQMEHRAVGALLDTVPAPLGFGRLRLAGGGDTLGFLACGPIPDGAREVTARGGWRAYVQASTSTA
jgi:allophanate hydrolase